MHAIHHKDIEYDIQTYVESQEARDLLRQVRDTNCILISLSHCSFLASRSRSEETTNHRRNQSTSFLQRYVRK